MAKISITCQSITNMKTCLIAYATIKNEDSKYKVLGINTIEASILDKDSKVVATAIFSEKGLNDLNLDPNEEKKWAFSFPKFNKLADLSRWAFKYNVSFKEELEDIKEKCFITDIKADRSTLIINNVKQNVIVCGENISQFMRDLYGAIGRYKTLNPFNTSSISINTNLAQSDFHRKLNSNFIFDAYDNKSVFFEPVTKISFLNQSNYSGKDFTQMLFDIKAKELFLESHKITFVLEHLFSRIFGGYAKVVFDYKGKDVLVSFSNIKKTGDVISLTNPPEEYSVLFFIIFDIISRSNILIKDIGDIYDIEGIILIKDLDIGASYKKPRDLYSILEILFPQIQFIFFTNNLSVVEKFTGCCIEIDGNNIFVRNSEKKDELKKEVPQQNSDIKDKKEVIRTKKLDTEKLNELIKKQIK